MLKSRALVSITWVPATSAAAPRRRVWDFDLEGARLRFDAIQGALDQRRKGCSISVGFAELQRDDTLDDLTAHGDAALYEEKHRKQEEKSADGRPRPTA